MAASNLSVDFDFFDDDADKGEKITNAISMKKFQRNPVTTKERESVVSSDSDYEATDSTQSDLHGVSENISDSPTESDKQSTVKSFRSNGSSSSVRDIPLHSQSHKTTSSESDDYSAPYYPKTSEKQGRKREKRKPSSLKVRSVSSDSSSDSVTDVSPLTSPDSSPNVNRLKPLYTTERAEESMRHITKLNVTFNRSTQETKSIANNRNNIEEQDGGHTNARNRKSYTSGSNAWSSNSDEDNSHGHYTGKNNANVKKERNHNSKSLREENAVMHHRQRLLDSAARGSMDVSSLLETVLQFEKQNHERKVRNRDQQPMNYRIGENMIKERRQKNMSFTNEQVREIDRENRRLLNEITSRSRPSSASSVRSNASLRSTTSTCSRRSCKSTSSRPGSSRRNESGKPSKLYHTAINRLQMQRQIERENMQLLKRLQSAKPTPGLQRQRQLKEYKRQSDFMGATVDRNGMSLRKAQKLTQNAEVVQNAIGLHNKGKAVRPAWQDSW